MEFYNDLNKWIAMGPINMHNMVRIFYFLFLLQFVLYRQNFGIHYIANDLKISLYEVAEVVGKQQQITIFISLAFLHSAILFLLVTECELHLNKNVNIKFLILQNRYEQ